VSEYAIDALDLFRVHRTTEGDAAALQGLTLRVTRGEVVAVLGPSGAGKSTLLRVLAGLEPPSAGVARVLGEDLGRLSAGRRAAFRSAFVGFVDQYYDHALAPSLTCAECIALPLALRGAGRRERLARAHGLLERVGLADRAGAHPAELSGGERQRVALCAALSHAPALLLADEPAGELDAVNARLLFGLIAELARDQGATVVVVSHDPLAATVADRAVRLRDGRVSEERRRGARSETLVVGRGGWLRLPEQLILRAGLGERVTATAAARRLVLEPVDDAGPADRPPATPPVAPVAAGRAPTTPAALRGVHKAYGTRTVLTGFSASFAPARLTAITGRSGSGKSTILRLLAGLERPEAGTICVGDDDLTLCDRAALAALRRARIGVVDQEPGLAAHLSARENVALALVLRGVPAARAGAIADARLAELGLAERTRQRTARLSAGERQRVAIARALAPEPGLLLVDEPTSRLDEANSAAVAELLASAARTHGTTIVCATHEPLVVDAADDVLELPDGFPKSPEAVSCAPRSPR
jgi:ABC-type lipoprotein export system ATPase subunit